MTTENIENKSFRNYQLTRFNDTGNRVISSNVCWVLKDGIYTKEEYNFPGALSKIIDEVITNAVDSYIKNNIAGRIDIEYVESSSRPKITDVEILEEVSTSLDILNASTGPLITITNWGNHIEFDKVIMAFSKEYSSSNYSDKVENIKGGTNGIGVKLTNILSKYFCIETCDGKQMYTITFLDNMAMRSYPKITPLVGKEYVRIKFEPDFSKICLLSKNQLAEDWYRDNHNIVNLIISRRVYEIATYTSAAPMIAGRSIPVYYNGSYIPASFDKFVQSHAGENKYIVTRIPAIKWPCYVGIITQEPFSKSSGVASLISNSTFNSTTTSSNLDSNITPLNSAPSNTDYVPRGFKYIIMINGVILEAQPAIIEDFNMQLVSYVRNHVDIEKYTGIKQEKGKFPNKLVTNNLIIIVMMQYPTQYFTYTGQVKSNIAFDKETDKYIKQNYKFTSDVLEKFWINIRGIMLKYLRPQNAVSRKIKFKMYVPAICLGRRPAKALFLVEGDSAATLMKYIINSHPKLGADNCGIMTTGGVPMNALKHSTLLPQGYQQGKKLRDNDGLQSIVKVLGLNPDDPNSMPRYKKLILCTDQDSDGVGKICSLIMVFFMIYFPKLVKLGFIVRYRTPIIRAIIAGKKYNFYSDQEFEEFKYEYNNCQRLAGKSITKITGTYYKGLGVHNARDRKEMVKSFFDDIVNIEYDDYGLALLHALYGVDTEQRKSILQHYNNNIVRRYANDTRIKLSEHFINESVPEQYGNIIRMVPNVYDGLVPVHRKILHVIRSKPKYAAKITVSALTGIIKGTMNYNHGEVAMESAIKRMAQTFTGSNWFPLILPWSASNGSRDGGKTETAAARYTNVIGNPFVDYYYPIEDDSLIGRVEEEGILYEPKYYISIIPRVLLESSKCVATGWNTNLTGRNYEKIMNFTRISIKTFPHIICTNLYGFPQIEEGMNIICYAGKEICTGSYTVNNTSFKHNGIEITDCINITQLPLGMSAKKYIKIITGADVKESKPKSKIEVEDTNYANVIAAIINNTADKVDIKLFIMPGVLDDIARRCKKPYLDNIIEYFKIYKIFTCNFNFYRLKDKLLYGGNTSTKVKNDIEVESENIIEDKNDIENIIEDKNENENIIESIVEVDNDIEVEDKNDSKNENDDGHTGLVEYDNMHDIFADWFVARRELYIKRIEKQVMYYYLKIKIQENICYFLKYNFIDKISKKPTNVCVDILSNSPIEYTNGEKYSCFERFNVAKLSMKTLGYAEDLYKLVTDEPTYNYILKLPISRVTEEKINKQFKILAGLYEDYEAAKKNTWQAQWAAELDRLDKLYKYAVEKEWYYEDILSYKV